MVLVLAKVCYLNRPSSEDFWVYGCCSDGFSPVGNWQHWTTIFLEEAQFVSWCNWCTAQVQPRDSESRRHPENASPTDIPDTFGFNLSTRQNTPLPALFYHSIPLLRKRCTNVESNLNRYESGIELLSFTCSMRLRKCQAPGANVPHPWHWWQNTRPRLLKAKLYTKKHRRSRQKSLITRLPPKFLAAGELDEIEVQQCVKHKQKQNTFLTFPYHNRGRRSTWQIMLCLRNLVLAKDFKSSSRSQYTKLQSTGIKPASWQPYPELGK